MNVRKIVADLVQEKTRIEEAITVMQRLDEKPRRGRPFGSKNKPPELRKAMGRVERPKKQAVA